MMDTSETTRLRALLERTAARVLTVAEERDAATKRAECAERERDDLAATLETRNAEHALAMARVRELEAALARAALMACLSPPDGCDCAGCAFAAEMGGDRGE